MTDRYTATEWAAIEGGHTMDTSKEEAFSFIKDLHEARMTKDNGSSKKLTFSDCCERLYLTLLILETMRKYPDFKNIVQKYAKKTVGFETYRYYRIMGTDLYNFIYFIVGGDSAQNKLKDPKSAKEMKRNSRIPVLDINRYIRALANGSEVNPSSLFIKLESALRITNSDYKAVRRSILNWDKQTRSDKRLVATRLIFATRAKLRSSDLIDDFEKWAAIKNMEKASVTDPEPTVSKPDLAGSQQNLALYRYLVGSKNLALTKRFLQQASNGQAASSGMVQAYMPAIEMLDDIVQAGPAYVNNLRALHKRAKKS
jgi:hypothetical protein|tara:strand:- start:3795 stop:4733 length:939 start_codon:yes stop_codon:yes gene_type:complete